MKKFGLTMNPEGWFGIADSEWINHESTVLIIIDMQNYGANRHWTLIGARGTGTTAKGADYYYDRIENIVIPAIQRLLDYFRSHSLPVIHVHYGSRLKDALDMPALWRLRFDSHAEDTGKSYIPYFDLPEMQIIDAFKTFAG